MEQIKNFLKTNTSASVSVICSKLEIPYKTLHPLLESVLEEMGCSNYRMLYSITSNRRIFVFTEKHKKELEELHCKQAKIHSIQRVTEDIANIYNNNLQHKEQLVSDELKNGGLFLPLYCNSGGFMQERREYNNQKKLNFRPKKVAPENKAKELKAIEDAKAVEPSEPEFVLEEEDFLRTRNEPSLMPFASIFNIEIQDLDDIMEVEASEVRFVREVRKTVEDESSEEEVKVVQEPKIEKRIEEPQKIVPKKRKGKFSENIEKKIYRESIIPSAGIGKSKLMQPSLATFFKK